VKVSSENGIEPSGSTKCYEVLKGLHNWQLRPKVPSQASYGGYIFLANNAARKGNLTAVTGSCYGDKNKGSEFVRSNELGIVKL
jgi:hypothetical protein